LAWQLGALSLRREVREAAEQIIGNLNEDGYLIASDDEMLGVAPPASPEVDEATARNIVSEAAALGLSAEEIPVEAESAPIETSSEVDDIAASISPDELHDRISAAASSSSGSAFSSVL